MLTLVEERVWKQHYVKFYEELSLAGKMKWCEALKIYVPNTAVNRKRLVGAIMEEKGIENTAENFIASYQKMAYLKSFDKLLAKKEETKTIFSARLMVEAARRKKAKEA